MNSTRFGRRTALTGLAALAAATRRVRAAATVSPVTATLSAYMAAAASRPLPDAALQQTRLHVLDTFGAMVSGSTLKPGHFAIAFARDYGGKPAATVVASNVLTGPIEAALANGVLAHSDETDDSHAPSQSHPGAPVLAATLAAAEHFGADGKTLLRAVALGYDVGTRMTMTLGIDALQKRGHRSTHAIAGGFGAAAAAGSCAGLDEQRMRYLLDYASQQSAGIAAWQRDVDHIEKAFVFAGMSARNGVNAAMLVAEGWTGLDDIFSGADNFFAANPPAESLDTLVDGLGTRYAVEHTNIKKWTVGSPIQAPLDALWTLMQREHFKAGDVRSVSVRVATKEAAVVDNRTIPDISLQQMMAVMLLDGSVSFTAANDVARMADPAAARERAKIKLVPDAELEKRLPAREAIVTVTLNDGRELTEHVTAVRGTAQNPMTQDEVVAKARDLMGPVLGRDQAESLIQAVLTLDQAPDLKALRPLLQVK